MKEHKLPGTVNLHFTKVCNAKCKFCFAAYRELKEAIPLETFKRIITMIAEEPGTGVNDTPRRINFVGGEPTIHKELVNLIAHAKDCGLHTSIVTNGFKLITEGIDKYVGMLDMIGLSIDSLDPGVIEEIGRYGFMKGVKFIPTREQWLQLAWKVHRADIDLKINTVVNRLNHADDMQTFIRAMAPGKWKIFQVTRVEGQNSDTYDDWSIGDSEFNGFVNRHRRLGADAIQVVMERSDWMINTYAMVGPNGSFVDDTNGHRYSRPICEAGIKSAWNEIAFDTDKFEARNCPVLSKEEVPHG